jgi:DNA-binding NarL/FixJ family response regulator
MIHLLIYEDNAVLRDGLAMLLNGTEGFRVLATYRNCKNVEAEVQEQKPDVVIMDIDMPGCDGIEGVRRIRQQDEQVKILMLTVFDDNKNIFEALKAGANGYMLKKTPPSRLLEAIQDVHQGGAPMTSSVASQVLQMFAKQNLQVKTVENNLSDREKEVLQLITNGYSYKMIAAEMFISVDTVRSHIKNIYEKLHVNSKSEAVAKAFRDKIL